MTTAISRRQPGLTGQTLVVIGGGADIGLQRARRARAEGAGLIQAGRDPGRPGAGRGRTRRAEQRGRRPGGPVSWGGVPWLS